MEGQDVLDSNLMLAEYTEMLPEVAWWEKRRVIYNILFVGLQVAMMVVYWEGTERFGYFNAILLSSLVALGANAFYCMGWGLEVLFRYYFGVNGFGTIIRYFFFVSGVCFSLVLAFFNYAFALAY